MYFIDFTFFLTTNLLPVRSVPVLDSANKFRRPMQSVKIQDSWKPIMIVPSPTVHPSGSAHVVPILRMTYIDGTEIE